MFLGNTLGAATSGLDSIERQLATLSQNVANASTPNYVRETTPVSSVDSAGGPAGVRTGGAVREIDVQLQANLFASVATEAGNQVTSDSLSGIDAASGTPGSGQDLASLAGKLQDSFSALDANPSDQTQQAAVLGAANSFVQGINSLSGSLVQARQKADDSLSDGVDAANTALGAIGKLSDQIISARAQGQSTAGLEDNRDGQMKILATLTGAKFVQQSSGDVQVIAGNTILPTRSASPPFAIKGSTISAASGGAVQPLMMNGSPLSSLGGEMGANLTLRDSTIPKMQLKLDTFTQSTAASFQLAKVPLLTDNTGNSAPPVLGFSATVRVSADIQANPQKLRDGSTGQPLQSGDNSTVQNVLNTVFPSTMAGAVSQASTLVAGFAQQSTQATTAATSSTALRTGLDTRLAARSGVSVDTELAQMVALQTAYAANAKVITAVQSMWQQLLQAVQ
ncbi:MAG: flagellar hook-associated protein FlgK [Lysobacteraceae bacterium]|nr:MAG: flagellar hook-associated protein FlgK [Xanthomonadaceae bacterium]